jgi:hypothetical protein
MDKVDAELETFESAIATLDSNDNPIEALARKDVQVLILFSSSMTHPINHSEYRCKYSTKYNHIKLNIVIIVKKMAFDAVF